MKAVGARGMVLGMSSMSNMSIVSVMGAHTTYPASGGPASGGDDGLEPPALVIQVAGRPRPKQSARMVKGRMVGVANTDPKLKAWTGAVRAAAQRALAAHDVSVRRVRRRKPASAAGRNGAHDLSGLADAGLVDTGRVQFVGRGADGLAWLAGPVAVRIACRFRTGDASKHGRAYRGRRVDADNLAKAILDALEEAGALPAGDHMVAELSVAKEWARDDGADIAIVGRVDNGERTQAPNSLAEGPCGGGPLGW